MGGMSYKGTCLSSIAWCFTNYQYTHVIVLGVGDNLNLLEKELQEKTVEGIWV